MSMAVAPWVVPDELWKRIEPLLPKVERRFRYPGRKRLPDRQALQGILFVLHTGIAWRHLPLELGFGGGSTCYRRLDEWQKAGVWEKLHALLLTELRAAGEIEWARRSPTPATCKRKGGAATGPSPVDRARNGSKQQLLVDPTGIPLAWTVTGGNRNDVTQLLPLVERVSPVRGKVGRHGAGPGGSPPTAATTMTSTGTSSAGAGSPQRSLVVRPSTAPASAAPAGWSSSPSPGYTTSNGCSSATTAAMRSTKPSSRSAAASSGPGGSVAHSDSSS
jgi:transposase